jgi:hypothetical protein
MNNSGRVFIPPSSLRRRETGAHETLDVKAISTAFRLPASMGFPK